MPLFDVKGVKSGGTNLVRVQVEKNIRSVVEHSFFLRADKSISYLNEMPEMYPIYPDIPLFRFIVVEDYLVFYRFIEERNLIEIHRILYGRMDIPTHIKRRCYQ